jgi:hypothetical protein
MGPTRMGMGDGNAAVLRNGNGGCSSSVSTSIRATSSRDNWRRSGRARTRRNGAVALVAMMLPNQ